MAFKSAIVDRMHQVASTALPTDEQSPEVEEASSPPSPPLSPRCALNQKFCGLSSREGEVTRFVAKGKSIHAIAYELVVG